MNYSLSTNLPTLDEVLLILRAELPDLRLGYEVKTLGVFGSYAKGSNKQRSDLDLLVEFENPPTMFEFVRLERHFSTLLGVKVDLVMKSALKPDIGKRILAEVLPV